MGQTKSKENRLLSQKTHFSKKEINHLRQNVQSSSSVHHTNTNGITEDVFKETVKKYVPSVSSHDDVFLKRLYAAFDVENNKSIDFEKFVDGLSVFMKGTPEEKLELSFKLYDVKHAGYLTRPDLERVMIQLSQAAMDDDQTNEIKSMVGRMFEDLDVDDDGKLTFEEYKLSVMKEPLIVDFLEQFLAEHHISQHPRVPSRPASVSSYRSGRSLTHPHNKLSLAGFPSSSSPIHSSSRLSVRVSQAELLEYGHHSIHSLSSGHSPTSLSTPGSPTSATSPKPNGNGHSHHHQQPQQQQSHHPPYHQHYNSTGSPSMTPRSIHHLSRPTSMTSLDAAISTMELSHTENEAHQPQQQNDKQDNKKPNTSVPPAAVHVKNNESNVPVVTPTSTL